MTRRTAKEQWRRKQKRQHVVRTCIMAVIAISIMLIGLKRANIYLEKSNPMTQYEEKDFELDQVEIRKGVSVSMDLLTPNSFSRPQIPISRVNGIVIHYVANPGTSAKNNRDYFENLATTQERHASSHFVVGLKGEVVQCIPLNEQAYASNQRNGDTISIEVCHPDGTGQFSKTTYKSVVALTAYLCEMFELEAKDVIRHYDVTGKLCPKYYVEHDQAWVKLKEDINKAIEKRKLES